MLIFCHKTPIWILLLGVKPYFGGYIAFFRGKFYFLARKF